MSDLNRLLDNLRIRVPGATDGALQLEVWNVVNDFLRRTNLWLQEVEMDITVGETVYDVTPDGVAEISRLMGVVDADNFAVQAFMQTPGIITLKNTPTATATYVATVACSISDVTDRSDYPVIPDWMWTRYIDAFADGVQGRMFSQIAKPYSNTNMAAYHTNRFNNAAARARVEGRRENVFSAQRWAYPSSFAVRRR